MSRANGFGINLRNAKLHLAFLAIAISFTLPLNSAAAQSSREVLDMLEARVHPADRELSRVVTKNSELKRATKDEIFNLFARAHAYYEERDFYTAQTLFIDGLSAHRTMGWPKDEPYQRATFLVAMSMKRFCALEARNCEIAYADRADEKYPRIKAAEFVAMAFFHIEDVPNDVLGEMLKERQEAINAWCGLLKANPRYLIHSDLIDGRRKKLCT